MTDVQNVVLVHGGFVDGSGWRGVYDLLTADGFNVSVVQNQTLSLESDVETTHQVLDQQDGPAILVGHSYGGVVITEAGRHERVAGLVYIAAFAPDAGESVNALIADPPPGAPVPPILPPVDGFLFLDREKFADVVRGRPAGGRRGVHGRLAGPVGRRGAQRRGHRAGLAQQAELVPGRHRRPHDPAAGAASHVRAGGRDRRRGGRQPLDLRLAAARDRRADQAGRPARPRRDAGDGVRGRARPA